MDSLTELDIYPALSFLYCYFYWSIKPTHPDLDITLLASAQ